MRLGLDLEKWGEELVCNVSKRETVCTYFALRVADQDDHFRIKFALNRPVVILLDKVTPNAETGCASGRQAMLTMIAWCHSRRSSNFGPELLLCLIEAKTEGVADVPSRAREMARFLATKGCKAQLVILGLHLVSLVRLWSIRMSLKRC